jgi:hypothetical protein
MTHCKMSRSALESNPASCWMGTGSSFSEVKVAGSWNWPLTPTGAKDEKEWSCTSPFLVCCYGVQRDRCTLPVVKLILNSIFAKVVYFTPTYAHSLIILVIIFYSYTYFGVSKRHPHGVVEFTSIDRTIMNTSLHPYKILYIKWQSVNVKFHTILSNNKNIIKEALKLLK